MRYQFYLRILSILLSLYGNSADFLEYFDYLVFTPPIAVKNGAVGQFTQKMRQWSEIGHQASF